MARVVKAYTCFAIQLRPQAANHIECTCIDHAICPGTNIGFSHLRLLMSGVHPHKPEGGASPETKKRRGRGKSARAHCLAEGAEGIASDAGEQFTEAMAVHVFRDDGKILVTWLLRSVSHTLPQTVSACGSPDGVRESLTHITTYHSLLCRNFLFVNNCPCLPWLSSGTPMSKSGKCSSPHMHGPMGRPWRSDSPGLEMRGAAMLLMMHADCRV